MAECEHLAKTSAYFDGELPEAEHPELLAHLATCGECQSLLGSAVSLDAAVSRAPKVAAAPVGARRRWALVAGGAAMAAAAAIALLLARKPQGHDASTPPQLALELPHERALEARFSGELFEPYRPRMVMRGDTNARESIPLATLAELEKRGNKRDLVAALASSGDLARAEEIAATLPAGGDAENDRAALALAAHDPERALRHAYAAIAAGSQTAWWNLGLAARDLGLPHVAEDAFDHVVKRGEAGWSMDAHALASSDPELVRERGFDAFQSDATAMILGRGPVPAHTTDYPTYARIAFHDALRAARSRDEVEALRPLATAVDAASGTTTARDALARVAASDFAVRGKFVDDYRALVEHKLPADRTTRFLAALQVAGAPVADIRVGALILAGQATAQHEAIRKIVEPWHDPWFDLLVERERIRAMYPGTDLRAEPALVHALDGCTNPAWAMRCGLLAQDLAELLFMTGRDDDAEARAKAAVELQVRAAMPVMIAHARSLLADIHRRHGRFALARAEFEEVVLAIGDRDPRLRRFAEIGRAFVAFAARDLEAARTLLPAASDPCCEGTDSIGLATAVDLARLTGDAKDIEHARAWIQHAHETGDEALALIGAARIDSTSIPAVVKWLADNRRPDADAQGLRTWAYATLISDAAAHAQWDHVIELGREEHPAGDAACVVVASSDNERLSVAVKTPDGTSGEATQVTPGEQGVMPEIVSPQLVAKLKGCDGIAVIARPPLHGRADLLPAELPWWFAGDSRAQTSLPPPDQRAVTVVDARPPDPSLPRLPALAPSREKFDVALAAGDATPSRVLAALGQATYAELHAHGIVAAADTDAAYLALSPDPDGVYALRADTIRASHLAAAPIVVLAACRAAAVAPLERQRWSLPDAFLAAGARAVIAADVAIPDREAREVFDDLHHRIASGTPIPKALAEVRASRGGWASHLTLFR